MPRKTGSSVDLRWRTQRVEVLLTRDELRFLRHLAPPRWPCLADAVSEGIREAVRRMRRLRADRRPKPRSGPSADLAAEVKALKARHERKIAQLKKQGRL